MNNNDNPIPNLTTPPNPEKPATPTPPTQSNVQPQQNWQQQNPQMQPNMPDPNGWQQQQPNNIQNPQMQPNMQYQQNWQQQNWQQQNPQMQTMPNPTKKKTKMIIIIASIAGAVVIALAVIITLLIVNNNKPDTTKKNDYETTSANNDNKTASSSDSTDFGGLTFMHVPGYKYQIKDSTLMAASSQYATVITKPQRSDFNSLKEGVEAGKIDINYEGGTTPKPYVKTINGMELIIIEFTSTDGKQMYNIISKAPKDGYVIQSGSVNRNYTFDEAALTESTKILSNVQSSNSGTAYDEPEKDLNSDNIQLTTPKFED